MSLESPLKLIQNRGTVDILVTLSGGEKLNVSQLREESEVSCGTIQRRLKELKKNDLVNENIGESENNRLEKAYRLTDKGEEICEILLSLKKIGI